MEHALYSFSFGFWALVYVELNDSLYIYTYKIEPKVGTASSPHHHHHNHHHHHHHHLYRWNPGEGLNRGPRAEGPGVGDYDTMHK